MRSEGQILLLHFTMRIVKTLWLLIKVGLRAISSGCKSTYSQQTADMFLSHLVCLQCMELESLQKYLHSIFGEFFFFVFWVLIFFWFLPQQQYHGSCVALRHCWDDGAVKWSAWVSRVTGFLQHLQWMSDSGALCSVEWILSAFPLAGLRYSTVESNSLWFCFCFISALLGNSL